MKELWEAEWSSNMSMPVISLLIVLGFYLSVVKKVSRNGKKPIKNFTKVAMVHNTVRHIKGEKQNGPKWLLWTTSNHQILGSLTSLGLRFRHVSYIEGFFNF